MKILWASILSTWKSDPFVVSILILSFPLWNDLNFGICHYTCHACEIMYYNACVHVHVLLNSKGYSYRCILTIYSYCRNRWQQYQNLGVVTAHYGSSKLSQWLICQTQKPQFLLQSLYHIHNRLFHCRVFNTLYEWPVGNFNPWI